jgi:hypothetical protein
MMLPKDFCDYFEDELVEDQKAHVTEIIEGFISVPLRRLIRIKLLFLQMLLHNQGGNGARNVDEKENTVLFRCRSAHEMNIY